MTAPDAARPRRYAVRIAADSGDALVDVARGELVALVEEVRGAHSGSALQLSVSPAGRSARALTPRALARRGVLHVPSGLSLFASLTVREHLELGRVQRRRPQRAAQVREWLPELEPILDRPAGLLSGGERRLVALGRALAGSPHLLLIEDATTGLSPRSTSRVGVALRAAADQWGTAVVAATRHRRHLSDVADRVVPIEQ